MALTDTREDEFENPDCYKYNPSPCRDYKDLTGSELQEWVNSIGGISRVSRIIGKSVRQIERYFSGDQKIPKIIKEYMKLSDRNLRLSQENARLRRLIK